LAALTPTVSAQGRGEDGVGHHLMEGKESKYCGDSIPYGGGDQRCSTGGAWPEFHVVVAVLLNGEDNKGGFSLFTLSRRVDENRLER
jgi:hypothetical protein